MGYPKDPESVYVQYSLIVFTLVIYFSYTFNINIPSTDSIQYLHAKKAHISPAEKQEVSMNFPPKTGYFMKFHLFSASCKSPSALHFINCSPPGFITSMDPRRFAWQSGAIWTRYPEFWRSTKTGTSYFFCYLWGHTFVRSGRNVCMIIMYTHCTCSGCWMLSFLPQLFWLTAELNDYRFVFSCVRVTYHASGLGLMNFIFVAAQVSAYHAQKQSAPKHLNFMVGQPTPLLTYPPRNKGLTRPY